MAKIVFCDDDPTMLKLVRMALRATEHEVFVAKDGAAGLALIEEVRPDMIFTDATMPKLSGIEMKEALAGRPGLDAIPVILVTGADLDAEELAAIQTAGWAAYLAKPFRVQELRDLIGRFV